MIHRTRCVVAFFAVALLSACTAQGDGPEVSEWTAPAWMTEQAQAKERFVPRLQACLDSKGWNVTVDESAGVLEPFSSEDEMLRASVDIDACLLEQGIDPTRFKSGNSEADLRVMYRQDLDTYECLVAQAVDLEQKPISEEKYVELGLSGENASLSESWLPYLDPAILKMEEADVADLKRICPERWSFGSTS